MTFLSMQKKILKGLKKQLNIYIYDYKTFDNFAKIFNKYIYLSTNEIFVIKDFPRIMPFVIIFKEVIFSVYDIELIKKRAQELLRQGICNVVVSNTIPDIDLMPCVKITAEGFLKDISVSKTNALCNLEPLFEERLKLPRAKDL